MDDEPEYSEGELDEAVDDMCSHALATGLAGTGDQIIGLAAEMLNDRPDGRNAPQYMSAIAVQLDRKGRAGEAQEMMDRALKKDPGSAELWRTKGMLLEGRGDMEGALGCYDKAVNRTNKDRLAAMTRLRMYALYRLGKSGECVRAAGAMMRLDPGDELAASVRASSLFDLGRHAEALEAADAGLEAFPESSAFELTRALAMMELGRDEEALAATNRFIRKRPCSAGIWMSKARMLARAGRAEPALDALTVSVSLDPSGVKGARKDRDLDPIRDTDRFRRLVG